VINGGSLKISNAKIVKTGDKTLALELEEKGYEGIA
jgi:Fe-S cluster assembly ATPase SufC